MASIIDELRNDHRDFDYGRLESVFGGNPYDVFNTWLEEAVSTQQPEANAFSLATVDATGQPASRILYLKELFEGDLIFYTNYASEKGQNLAHNPKAGMLFFWAGLQRQVRVEGVCEKVSDAMSDAYFQSRPYGSKIGAWASAQSEQLAGREELEKRIIALSEKYPVEVPRPPHWGGYRLKPAKFEFWQGRPSRLHDRIVFERIASSTNTAASTDWNIYRLNP